jgi:NADH:ubiquinone oxidoreductase subunit F (NADH-binding)/(2Fe-2S) ferredoxin
MEGTGVMETLAENKNGEPIEVKIEVGACSLQNKAGEIARAFENELSRLGQEAGTVKMSRVGCRGLCFQSPLVEITSPALGKTVYQNVKPVDVSPIIRDHLIGGKPLSHLAVAVSSEQSSIKQERRVLRNCGEIDPVDVEAYCSKGGFKGLEKALGEMKPEEVLTEIRSSRLRNRDSHAHPTGEQLEDCKKHKKGMNTIVCRGEGESSEACISMILMEGDPLGIIEGMTLAAYCMQNVRKGYIVHDEKVHPLIVERVATAISNAHEKGFLGEGIMGTSFSFDLEIRASEDEFSSRGYSSSCKKCAQLLGTPFIDPGEEETCCECRTKCSEQPNAVFNAETLATLPLIVANGSSWFKEVGTVESPGTKIFSLVGNVEQPGVVEVAFGTTLSQILSFLNNDPEAVKAFVLGGLKNGFLPNDCINIPLTHKDLDEVGNRVGSGRVLIIDHRQSILDMTRYAVQKEIDESHGRSLPCVTLLKSISNLLDRTDEGLSRADVLLVKETAETLRNNAQCDFVKITPSVVLSGLQYFSKEFTDGGAAKSSTSA